jgi:hypothetical protein
LVCLSAGFSYLNHPYIKLPVTMGLRAIAMLVSLVLLLLAKLGYGIEAEAESFIRSIDFDETLSLGMLLLLLYARTVHVNLDDLLEQKWFIVTFGVALSVAVESCDSWQDGTGDFCLPHGDGAWKKVSLSIGLDRGTRGFTIGTDGMMIALMSHGRISSSDMKGDNPWAGSSLSGACRS